MEHKRITLLAGHYGSGKTNIAVNLAVKFRETDEKVAVADLDIVNPYYRTKDSEDIFKERDIRLIVSEYANSNLDIPALPQDMYAVTDDRSLTAVIDVGGDDRGALALGRLTPFIREENDYEMLMVINRFRPLTPDAASTQEVMREIETACGLPFTGLINNSNLGAETTEETILSSVEYGEAVSELTGLPVVITTVENRLYEGLKGKIGNLLPMILQKRPME